MAEELRIGAIKTRVYKGDGEFGQLGELSRAYTMVVSDSVRVQNRIKSLYRSRGIPAIGKEVYAPAAREKWLRKLPAKTRPLAAILYQELDGVRDLQKRSEKEMRLMKVRTTPASNVASFQSVHLPNIGTTSSGLPIRSSASRPLPSGGPALKAFSTGFQLRQRTMSSVLNQKTRSTAWSQSSTT